MCYTAEDLEESCGVLCVDEKKMNLINLKMNLKHKMWENLKESSNFVNALYMLTLSVSRPLIHTHSHTRLHARTHTLALVRTRTLSLTHTHRQTINQTLTNTHTHTHTAALSTRMHTQHQSTQSHMHPIRKHNKANYIAFTTQHCRPGKPIINK